MRPSKDGPNWVWAAFGLALVCLISCEPLQPLTVRGARAAWPALSIKAHAKTPAPRRGESHATDLGGFANRPVSDDVAAMKAIPWTPDAPVPTQPAGTPDSDRSDPWDSRAPRRLALLRGPIPVPRPLEYWSSEPRNPADFLESVHLDRSGHLDFPRECEDCEPAGYLQLHAIRKVDLDRDGTPEVVLLIEENTGGSGSYQFLVAYKVVRGALRFLGMATRDAEFYNYLDWGKDLRRLGHCIEVVAKCDVTGRIDGGSPCRMVFGWTEGRFRLVEHARRDPDVEWIPEEIPTPPGTLYRHHRADDLPQVCGL